METKRRLAGPHSRPHPYSTHRHPSHLCWFTLLCPEDEALVLCRNVTELQAWCVNARPQVSGVASGAHG